MYSKIIFIFSTVCIINASVITSNADKGVEEVQTIENTEDSAPLRSCNYQECNQRCRRLEFPGGVCVNGRCKCDNFRTAEDAALDYADYAESHLDSLYSLTSPKCRHFICKHVCRFLGYDNGTCTNNRCECTRNENSTTAAYNNMPEQVEDTKLIENEENNNAEIATEDIPTMSRSCNNAGCNNVCRRLGFRWGICSISTCRCYS